MWNNCRNEGHFSKHRTQNTHMTGSLSTRAVLLGLASWAVPFFGSFVFFDSTGELAIPLPLFKSIMVVFFGGFDTWLLTVAFRRIPPTPGAGFILGTLWLVMNLVLDAALLLPLSGQTFPEYFVDIGLRYFLMPIIATCMGSVAAAASSTRPDHVEKEK
eukprot:m.243298 g.243298  ORF g.243298 m.243298 type:complete len:159 (+) comp27298_c0_seq1:312-788(+)